MISLRESKSHHSDVTLCALPPVREGSILEAQATCEVRPSQLVLGSQKINAETLCEKRSHQLGEGQSITAEMLAYSHPFRLVYGRNTSRSQQCQTAIDTFHQLGEGHEDTAKISIVPHPSRPVYGSLCYHAAMPIYDRSHLFTRGQSRYAAMPRSDRLSREGSIQHCNNARIDTPFPTSFGPPQLRSNANLKTPN